MLSETERNAVEKGFVNSLILWGAIFFSLFIYLVIVHLLGDQIRPKAGSSVPLPLFRNILIGVGVAEIFLIQFLRKRMLSKNALLKAKERVAAPGQLPYVAQYTTVTLISAALAESIGIYGLLLFFLGDGINVFYVFLAASAVLMVLYRPQKEELVTLAMEMVA